MTENQVVDSFEELMSERDRLNLRQAEIAALLENEEDPPAVGDLQALILEQSANARVLAALEPRIQRAYERDRAENKAKMDALAVALRPQERAAFLAVVEAAEELYQAIADLREVYVKLSHVGAGPITVVPVDLVRWTTPGVGGGLQAWASSVERIAS